MASLGQRVAAVAMVVILVIVAWTLLTVLFIAGVILLAIAVLAGLVLYIRLRLALRRFRRAVTAQVARQVGPQPGPPLNRNGAATNRSDVLDAEFSVETPGPEGAVEPNVTKSAAPSWRGKPGDGEQQ